MAGESCLDSKVGGFAVANLTHHNDVRVLAQQGTQTRGKGHPGLRVNLGLVDPAHPVLHRVFDCGNINTRGIEHAEYTIKSRRLTGSGKSTTLYSVLSMLNTSGVNISTIEDPVEYRVSGVNQTQVNPKAGMTFASGLRALLRQDPNVIMVGEIRDSETADLAVQAALTGHVVLSTLHTNNAATTLPRLLDMNIE